MGQTGIEIWVATATIAAASIAVVGSLVLFALQRRADRLSVLRHHKRQLYAEFLESLMSSGAGANPHRYNEVRMQIALVASDAVLRSMNEFAGYAARSSKPGSVRDMNVFKNLLAGLLLEMRRDVFDKTSLGKKELALVLPIED